MNIQLKKHEKTVHEEKPVHCEHCNFTCNTKESLEEHHLKAHPQIVIFHTMAKQVDYITDTVETDQVFKADVINLLKKLFEKQNVIEQELFLIRNTQADLLKKSACPVPSPSPPPASQPSPPASQPYPSQNPNSNNIKVKQTSGTTKEEIKESKSKNNSPVHKQVKNITWFGTSVSKALDKKKFEQDTKAEVKFVKALRIKREENPSYPNQNFTDAVSKELENTYPDAIILQGGSVEISNIDMKAALMDTEKDIEKYRAEWAAKVEEDSANLFNIAETAVDQNPGMKVIIVKRLPRFDPISSDPKGIKKQLSKFGNHVFDQLWFKKGCPENIHIVELDLGCSGQGYLKDLIYGLNNSPDYDGVHLRGKGAQRHFTYRAVCATQKILRGNTQVLQSDDHTNCPQAQYQRAQYQRNRESKYIHPTKFAKSKVAPNNFPQAFQCGQNYYSIPVRNRFMGNF